MSNFTDLFYEKGIIALNLILKIYLILKKYIILKAYVRKPPLERSKDILYIHMFHISRYLNIYIKMKGNTMHLLNK